MGTRWEDQRDPAPGRDLQVLESKKNGGLDGPALGNRIEVTVFLMGKVSQLAQMEGLNIRLACLKLDIFRAIYYS